MLYTLLYLNYERPLIDPCTSTNSKLFEVFIIKRSLVPIFKPYSRCVIQG